jgi:hypothetical protein
VDSYDGPAVFRQGGADVEIRHCAFTTQTHELGLNEWRGHFENPPEYVPEVGEAILVLPSGEEGKVVITEYVYRLAGVGRGTFVGSGPAPSMFKSEPNDRGSPSEAGRPRSPGDRPK